MNRYQAHGWKVIDFLSIKEESIIEYSPVAGSYAVLSCNNVYLICYNTYRKQWEFPAGQRENGETSKECALRELYEETGQMIKAINFIGLLKLQNIKEPALMKYNPVYMT